MRKNRSDTEELQKLSGEPARPQHSKDRELREKEQLPRVPKWVYRVMLVLLLTIGGMAIWFNRENLTPSNISDWVQTQVLGMGVGEGFPQSLNGDEVQPENFCVEDGRLLLTGNTTILSLNASAKELFSRKHGFSSPVMEARGRRVLVYNLGGKGYRLENQVKTQVNGTADQNILCGALATTGAYVLVTEDAGYCGKLTAYTRDNKEAYHYWFSDAYPTAVAVNEEGTRAAVTAVKTVNGVLQSSIYLLDFNSTETVTPAGAYQDTVFTGLSYQGGTVLAVGDKRTVLMSEKGEERANYDYQGAELNGAAIDGTRAALCLSSYQNATSARLVTLDGQGKVQSTIETDFAVADISLYGDTVAVLAHERVQAYSAASGKATTACDAGSDARAIALSSERAVYILGVSEVRAQELS